MLTLPNTVALILASSLATVHVAALPRPQEANKPRAVDVEAFTPWEMHPQEPANAQHSVDLLNATPSPAPQKTPQISHDTEAKELSTKRGTNPEGFVPYMHFPSGEGGKGTNGATNPATHEVGDPEKPGTPLAERDDYQTVVDENRNEEAVNVVPIVGGKRGLDIARPVDSVWKDERRDLDPAQIAEENRNERVVNITPIVGERRGLEAALPMDSPKNDVRRDLNPAQIAEENRNEKLVDTTPIVGEKRGLNIERPMESLKDDARRDLDPAQIAEENRDERVVNITPIVGEKRGLKSALPVGSNWDNERRDLDAAQIAEENRNEKEVDVVPIVGRAVDTAALTSLARRCGANEVKYDPSKD